MFRRAAAHEGPLQGVNVGIKDDGIEMPDDNGESGQDGLVVVDGRGDVESDLGEVFKHEVVRPKENARDRHDHGPPDQRPVLELLRVIELGVKWSLPAVPQIIADGLLCATIFRPLRGLTSSTNF